MPPKRKQPERAEEDDQNEQIRGNQQQPLLAASLRAAASHRAVRKPFKPPMASRPEANGRSVQVGLSFSRLALLGPGGLLQAAVTKTVSIGRRLGEGLADDGDAPDAYVKVLVDKFIASKLRPHQVEGVQFMFKCLAGLRHANFRGCIQSDSMGLGKTFQSICCLWTLLTTGITGRPTCSRALVITPTSLVANWGREVDKWLGGRIKPTVIEDAAQLKAALARLGGGYVPPGRCSAAVLIMSYDVFRLNQEAVYCKKFELVICDEAHRLKNGASKINQAVLHLPCKLRLLLTGTPIQNDLSEYYAMFSTACPGLFGTPAQFRKKYENPILAGRDAGASDKQLQNGSAAQADLVQLSSQYIIRRSSETLKQYLPAKIQEVIFCKMSTLQYALYRGIIASEPVQAALEGRKLERDRALATLPAINALKKLCCHPDMARGLGLGRRHGRGWGWIHTERAASTNRSTYCRTAIWNLQRGPGAAVHSHLLGGGHSNGSGRAAKPSGKGKASGAGGEPRAVVTGMEGLGPVFGGSDVYPAYSPGGVQAMHSGKMQVLVSLLKAIREGEAGDKVVLVSNYTESLALCDKVCKANRWSTLSLTGDLDARKRQALVDEFNSPAHPSYVLLLSSKARSTHQLHVTVGSIEEKIFQRQLAKEGLSRVVVDDNADEQRTFSRDELKALFRVDPQIQCDTHTAIKCSCDGSWPRAQEPVAGAGRILQPGPPQQAQQPVGDGDNSTGSDTGTTSAKQLPATASGKASGKAAAESAPQVSPPPPQQPQQPAAANPGSVLSWAHVRDVTLLPDRVWQRVSAPIRNAYITFAFSDFNFEEKLDLNTGAEGEDDDGDSIDREAAAKEELDPEDWEAQGPAGGDSTSDE
ncbi:Protein CHROMATIN REMODELING 25 [Chlorella vulgaris]